MNILVTGAARVQPVHLERIEATGHRVALMQDERGTLPVPPHNVHVVMCNSLFTHHSVKSFSQLRLVQATSAGLDRLPMNALLMQGVRVEPARSVYSPAIAEFVILLLLQIFKSSRNMLRSQDRKEWLKQRNLRELTGLTACVIGPGSIGKEVAARLEPFGTTVKFVGRRTRQQEADHLIAAADIVILSAPLTPETHHLLDRKRLSSMRKDSVLINVSRGQLIDEAALVDLLNDGHFYGVGLDVFEREPLPSDSPLWTQDRVIISPHNSFVSDRTTDRLVSLLMKNLEVL